MTAPHSLGLKHLASRPKKQQLIEDRLTLTANENAMMMERISNIVSNFKEEEKHPKMAGRNEAFRRREIERINAENRHIVDRLQTVPAIFNAKKLELEFQNHLKDVKKMMNYAVPSPQTKKTLKQGEPFLIDATGEQSLSGILEQPNATMNAISLFRQQVVSVKKENNREASRSIGIAPATNAGGTDTFALFHARHARKNI